MRIKSLVVMSSLIFVLIFMLIPMAGCNAVENLTTSSSMIVIESITGTDLLGNTESTTVFSDVITTSGTVFNDTATAAIAAYLIDPEGTSSTVYQDVILDQVDINFTRSDIASPVQGRDVPYSFSQGISARIPVGDTVSVGFVLVQHNSKLEPPLVELINYGQEHILRMEAHVTFHGKDVAGNRVQPVTGVISVWFGNFGDDN